MPATYALPAHGRRRVDVLLVAATAAALVSLLLAGSARPASPNAGLIGFTRSDGIYVMEADGSGVRPLWRGARAVTDLAWSPDGRRLAFGTWGGVRVMNADGSGVVRIASVVARSLSWSPDGRRMAFTDGWDIWVMDADGSDMRRLKRTPGLGEGNVDWSPAGGPLVFDSGGWVPSIFVMTTDGRHSHEIAWDGAEPDWSPDGKRIVFDRPADLYRCEIYVMNADGSGPVRLTENRAPDSSPAWSPGGRRIAFVRGVAFEDSSEIYVMNADGTGVRRLTHNRVADWSPAWQPVAPGQD